MSTGPDPSPSARGQLSAEDLITLNEEIASMAKAGLPLDQGMSVLAREMGRGRLQAVTQQLANDLRAGHTLPEALERQKGRVPSYYAALLSAGIRSGRLGDVLGTLTIYARGIADFRANAVSALVYPGIVFVLGVGLIVFAALFVLPAFAKIYLDFRMKLPLVTEWLLYIGAHPIEFVIGPPIVLIVAVIGFRMILGATPQGQMIWARIVYAVPVFGTLLRSARLAAFTDLLGILVDQKIPLPEALSLAAATSSDPLLSHGVTLIEADIRQGVLLGAALKKQRLVPELVVWMVGFGERQGNLGASLRQVADMYRRQADVRAVFLRTTVPPFLIVFVAIIVGGTMVLGLTMPLLQLMDGLSGGLSK